MDTLTRAASLAGHNQRVVLTGCRNMLSEAAEQFRINGAQEHAGFCELHKDELERTLQGLPPYSDPGDLYI